ncbi:hypothetical protein BT63DRAFT_76990 [Microthyrium microscopicum]|uniref:CENP-V/GFA domain-containing protein n=1 Tax=Microthyrium microscopicum TaxID=703497 RepID=A0A6A6U2K4_9PEZI|nr:hypothetical protein BT63DRAFT_76990 [Microthyrium microscopicum]
MILTCSCHCGGSKYSFTVPKESLPLQAYLCSCNTCRRISGVLLTSYVPIPPENPSPNLECVSTYKSSEAIKRHFCSNCGAHLFLEHNDDGHFEVSTGTLQSSNGIVTHQGHIWLAETVDGGASIWIKEIGAHRTKQYLKDIGSELAPFDWRDSPSASERGCQSTDNKLHVHCHCRGVEFCITRPNEQSLLAESPFPDLLVPYNSGKSAENPSNVSWWLSEDRKRYLAGHCACKSCRLISGFDIVQWTFVPTDNIELPDGRKYEQGMRLGTAKTYESSPGTTRHFCGDCGADVFWEGSQRPTLLDVAIGLLDAESGARAEEWLQWVTDRVSFSEEAHNQQLIQSLCDGLGKYPKE